MFCSVAMQNYFPETRQGRPVSMKTREGEREWREGMRGKGVTGSRVNQKVRAEVRCGLWVGQSEDWVPLKVKDDAHLCAKAQGGILSGDPVPPFCHAIRELWRWSQASSRAQCIDIGSILTQLHTFGLITAVCRPAQLSAFIRLAFFWGVS